jgi:hypothetical protein
MLKLRYSVMQWPVTLILLALSGTTLGLALPSAKSKINRGFKQNKVRTLTRQMWDAEPIQVSDYKVKGTRSVKNDEPFEEASNWLDNLSFTITNSSPTPITFIQVNIIFPESRQTGLLIKYTFDVGHSLIDKVKRGEPFSLAPGETTTFVLNEWKITALKTVLQRRGYQIDDLTKAEFGLDQVEFIDKKVWFGSQWFKYNESTGKLDNVST